MMILHFILWVLLPLQAGAACGTGPQKTSGDGFRFVSNCNCDRNWERVEKTDSIKSMLRHFGRKVGQQLPVYSCFRDQDSQDAILRRNRCAPNYGPVECSGRIAANVSEHTVGVAADFFVENYRGSAETLCRELDATRHLVNGGWGGLTVYGIDKGKAYMHIDVKQDWCNWGVCEKVLGEGNCKRTKFRQKRARVEQELAAARVNGSRENVRRLEAVLAELDRPCRPGDANCRDLFKN